MRYSQSKDPESDLNLSSRYNLPSFTMRPATTLSASLLLLISNTAWTFALPWTFSTGVAGQNAENTSFASSISTGCKYYYYNYYTTTTTLRVFCTFRTSTVNNKPFSHTAHAYPSAVLKISSSVNICRWESWCFLTLDLPSAWTWALNQFWIDHETKAEEKFWRASDRRGLPPHERGIIWDPLQVLSHEEYRTSFTSQPFFVKPLGLMNDTWYTIILDTSI